MFFKRESIYSSSPERWRCSDECFKLEVQIKITTRN